MNLLKQIIVILAEERSVWGGALLGAWLDSAFNIEDEVLKLWHLAMIRTSTLKPCSHVTYTCACVDSNFASKFNIVSLGTQMRVRKMGYNPNLDVWRKRSPSILGVECKRRRTYNVWTYHKVVRRSPVEHEWFSEFCVVLPCKFEEVFQRIWGPEDSSIKAESRVYLYPSRAMLITQPEHRV